MSAIAAATVAAPASGQSVGRMVGSDLKHVGQDAWAVWTSPFDASRKDWLTTALVLGAGAAISPLDDEVDRWTVRDSASGLFKSLKPFRKGGYFFQGNKIAPVAGAVLIAGYVTKNQNIRDGIWGCAVSWGSNNLIRHQVLYRFINRRRPDPHKDNEITTPPARQGTENHQYIFALSAGDTSWGDNSFPGGHVANLTACTGFLNNRFEMGYVEPVLYALAAGVGVGRLADRAHWASDQLVGAIFGYAIGREVAQRQLKRKRDRDRDRLESASPIPTSSHSGFYLISDPQRGMGIGWQRGF